MKKISLTFTRDNLLYDISNYCYVEGDIMKVEDENRRHQVIDVSQPGNVDRVTRVLDISHAYCVEMLYPYTKLEVADGNDLVNRLVESDQYVINMKVGDDFSKTTHEYLLRLIHEFLVCNVLFDWLSITDIESSEKWKMKSEYLEGQIRSCMNNGMRPKRITQSPF